MLENIDSLGFSFFLFMDCFPMICNAVFTKIT